MNIRTNTWVEKYRPKNLKNLVLEENNRKILENILESKQFPNLLFYGPPGTGKTTTAINLIHEYQVKNKQQGKELIIHLNASDDRGIDIIRNQIYHFINTKTLFGNGLKFVVLDEVDYMTKSAQQALKSIIRSDNSNVRYCLICNYISKIDKTLQKEFIKLHFNNFSKTYIYQYLNDIILLENLSIHERKIYEIIGMFKNDIRSMVNFIQSNKDDLKSSSIIDNRLWDDVIDHIERTEKLDTFYNYIYDTLFEYNMDEYEFCIRFMKYMFSKYPSNKHIYHIYKFVIHNNEANTDYIIKFIFFRFKEFLYILKNN